MDLALVPRQRLKQLGLEQSDSVNAARVIESYISQLLADKKVPPAPGRTDIYDKMGELLGSRMANSHEQHDLQRTQEVGKYGLIPPGPLFKDVRESVIHKCHAENAKPVRPIFK